MLKSILPSTSGGITDRDVLFAKESIPFLQACIQNPECQVSLQMNGHNLILPEVLKRVLRTSFEFLAAQRAVTVIPADEEIGTQEAADILKVSRPYFVKLLDSGVIASKRVGVQRRVSVGDVLAYQEQEKVARRGVLVELVAEGQRLNIGE